MTWPPAGDEGFTLIEAVIAILVISIAVLALVGGLATMIQLTQHHRGHAVAETAARSFGQAVQATAQSAATLASSAGSSGSITVTDASTLPEPGSNAYLVVEREIVRLTGINRSTGVLTVARGQGGTTAVAHAVTATNKPAVVPLLHCPTKADVTPPTTSYNLTAGVMVDITDVQFRNATTGAFTSTSGSACEAAYDVLCPGTTLLPECGTGLYRVVLRVTTPGDSRFKNISADTQVLVRAGSG